MSDTESTDGEQKPWLFKPGQSGNPAGRPKGARAKLGDAFLGGLISAFNERGPDGTPLGVAAIRRARDEEPAAFCRTLASLMPKELTGKDGEQLFPRITVKFGTDG